MTSSDGNIFRVTGPLCGEFTGPRWIPSQRSVTRSFDVFFDLRLNIQLSKQSWGRWFETQSCSLWRHCNAQYGSLKFFSRTAAETPYFKDMWVFNTKSYLKRMWAFKTKSRVFETLTRIRDIEQWKGTKNCMAGKSDLENTKENNRVGQSREIYSNSVPLSPPHWPYPKHIRPPSWPRVAVASSIQNTKLFTWRKWPGAGAVPKCDWASRSQCGFKQRRADHTKYIWYVATHGQSVITTELMIA